LDGSLFSCALVTGALMHCFSLSPLRFLFFLDMRFYFSYSTFVNIKEELKAVLFDIDDTLFDRKNAVKKVIRRIIKKLPDLFSGIPQEKIFKAFHEADQMILEDFNKGESGDVVRDKRSRRFLKTLGLDEDFSDRITTMYISAYPDVSTPVQEAKEVVERLAEKYSLGVISNAFPDIQYHKLEGIGVRNLFQLILLSEEVGIRKPQGAIFQKAAELLNVQPYECLFVGDSYDTDIVGAKKAGMKACWFNSDGKKVPDEDIKPDFEITALSELLSILL